MLDRLALALSLSPALLFACGGDDAATAADAAPADAAVEAVALRFAAEIGGTAFQCGASYDGVGSASSTYVAHDFRFYVHDVRLLTAGATPTEVPVTLDVDGFQNADGVALLDFEDATAGCDDGTAARHATITGTVPAGLDLKGLRFTLGIPDALDHLDANTAAAPLDVIPLWWTWRAGYKFTKIDGTVGGAGFFLHLGSIGCPGPDSGQPPTGACAHPDQVAIELPDFAPATSTVVADVAPVFATVDVSANTLGTAPGCMSDASDPECVAIFPRLALTLDTTPPGPQLLFTERP